MGTITQKLNEIKQKHGAHAVVFNRPGPSGSPAMDYTDWVVRLALCFGSPNYLATGHVCQWHKVTGSQYTYGRQRVPSADFKNTALLIIWGHNPYNSGRSNVVQIERAIKRGAKLMVIDPRFTPIAKKADLWLQIRPGTDGALILGLINLLIKEKRYDKIFFMKFILPAGHNRQATVACFHGHRVF
jgi:anaerobic selenocysteine-containing dehydrogenase